ncbi:hypothetical protein [Ferviditalea candida]|uniref:Uncharacterized protein n=1 Tax=Ferviditalea candida TaxID=3108399 RepID=A0ABU5ZGY2_9BACL|nr:hypothetical protein [Paenibacillaceae bacterium T2]
MEDQSLIRIVALLSQPAIGEMPSKRTPYSTHFLNPDGSFSEEIYLEPKFYQDPADHSWKAIDNSGTSSKSNTRKTIFMTTNMTPTTIWLKKATPTATKARMVMMPTTINLSPPMRMFKPPRPDISPTATWTTIRK